MSRFTALGYFVLCVAHDIDAQQVTSGSFDNIAMLQGVTNGRTSSGRATESDAALIQRANSRRVASDSVNSFASRSSSDSEFWPFTSRSSNAAPVQVAVDSGDGKGVDNVVAFEKGRDKHNAENNADVDAKVDTQQVESGSDDAAETKAVFTVDAAAEAAVVAEDSSDNHNAEIDADVDAKVDTQQVEGGSNDAAETKAFVTVDAVADAAVGAEEDDAFESGTGEKDSDEHNADIDADVDAKIDTQQVESSSNDAAEMKGVFTVDAAADTAVIAEDGNSIESTGEKGSDNHNAEIDADADAKVDKQQVESAVVDSTAEETASELDVANTEEASAGLEAGVEEVTSDSNSEGGDSADDDSANFDTVSHSDSGDVVKMDIPIDATVDTKEIMDDISNFAAAEAKAFMTVDAAADAAVGAEDSDAFESSTGKKGSDNLNAEIDADADAKVDADMAKLLGWDVGPSKVSKHWKKKRSTTNPVYDADAGVTLDAGAFDEGDDVFGTESAVVETNSNSGADTAVLAATGTGSDAANTEEANSGLDGGVEEVAVDADAEGSDSANDDSVTVDAVSDSEVDAVDVGTIDAEFAEYMDIAEDSVGKDTISNDDAVESAVVDSTAEETASELDVANTEEASAGFEASVEEVTGDSNSEGGDSADDDSANADTVSHSDSGDVVKMDTAIDATVDTKDIMDTTINFDAAENTAVAAEVAEVNTDSDVAADTAVAEHADIGMDKSAEEISSDATGSVAETDVGSSNDVGTQDVEANAAVVEDSPHQANIDVDIEAKGAATNKDHRDSDEKHHAMHSHHALGSHKVHHSLHSHHHSNVDATSGNVVAEDVSVVKTDSDAAKTNVAEHANVDMDANVEEMSSEAAGNKAENDAGSSTDGAVADSGTHAVEANAAVVQDAARQVDSAAEIEAKASQASDDLGDSTGDTRPAMHSPHAVGSHKLHHGSHGHHAAAKATVAEHANTDSDMSSKAETEVEVKAKATNTPVTHPDSKDDPHPAMHHSVHHKLHHHR